MIRKYLIKFNYNYKKEFEVINKEDFMKSLNHYRNENKNKYFVDVKEDFKFGLIHQDWIFEHVVLRVICDDYDDLFEFVQGDNKYDK